MFFPLGYGKVTNTRTVQDDPCFWHGHQSLLKAPFVEHIEQTQTVPAARLSRNVIMATVQDQTIAEIMEQLLNMNTA